MLSYQHLFAFISWVRIMFLLLFQNVAISLIPFFICINIGYMFAMFVNVLKRQVMFAMFVNVLKRHAMFAMRMNVVKR